ncbi:hypothetical protein [Acinetobacter sp. ANC 4648]|uniref:hypothetical protein n=1 Tax=Acinetobacter sp. ANC 4648 TaxID=1977875 RepID=UPI000A33A2DB|nr:hypothetical protein [Acinetobacter sp. ANC 4648]OTG82132.1 hypothetical protein B9T27_07715 [Acinetobacter sp. ANC 4648]
MQLNSHEKDLKILHKYDLKIKILILILIFMQKLKEFFCLIGLKYRGVVALVLAKIMNSQENVWYNKKSSSVG